MSSYDDHWKDWLRDRTPERDADTKGLAELADLTRRSFSSPYLTREETKRRDYLASHLRQRITLNPGPFNDNYGNEDYVRWEGKAREILASIAVNPDGHHWSYIAMVIQEAVDEAMGKS